MWRDAFCESVWNSLEGGRHVRPYRSRMLVLYVMHMSDGATVVQCINQIMTVRGNCMIREWQMGSWINPVSTVYQPWPSHRNPDISSDNSSGGGGGGGKGKPRISKFVTLPITLRQNPGSEVKPQSFSLRLPVPNLRA